MAALRGTRHNLKDKKHGLFCWAPFQDKSYRHNQLSNVTACLKISLYRSPACRTSQIMPDERQEALLQNYRWPALSRDEDLASKYTGEVDLNTHRTAWETNNKEYWRKNIPHLDLNSIIKACVYVLLACCHHFISAHSSLHNSHETLFHIKEVMTELSSAHE